MVYDPIRDCNRPSPTVGESSSSPGGVGYGFQTPGSQLLSDDPRRSSTGVSNGRNVPPAFQDTGSSPGISSIRSVSGGLKSLLNDDSEEDGRRRSSGNSGHGASAGGSGWSEDDNHRPSIHRLLNDTTPTTAPPISKSNSASSLTQASGSPLTSSPGREGRHRYLDQAGFLTPATPANILPRNSRSPYPPHQPHPIMTNSSSPSAGFISLPNHQSDGGYYADSPQAGPSSRRQSLVGQNRPMPPPELPRTQEYYDHTPRSTPQAGYVGLPIRSPSVSVSPRSHYAGLPPQVAQVGNHPHSRPTSAASNHNQPFYFQGPSGGSNNHILNSPGTLPRRLSEEPRPPSATSSRRGTMQARRSSQASLYSATTPIRSPSPIPLPPYNPHRTAPPSAIFQTPITPEEISKLKKQGQENNPLRKRRIPLPSWSASTPSRQLPSESTDSYFPPTTSSSTGAGPSGTYPPAWEENEVQQKQSAPKGRRRPTVDIPEPAPMGRHPKRPSEQDEIYETGSKRGQKRKVSDINTPRDEYPTYSGNAATVASHYNSRPEVGVQHREFSPIIGLKKFNNWIKSVLVGKFAYRPPQGDGAKVLDIGCGKGGDLNKWKQARISLYVALDIASTSVEQAEERFRKINRPGFDAHFFAHDCYAKPLSDVLPENLQKKDLYDNVTMQFCMHYAFENASKARMMIENVSRYLRKGGVFIGTIPNSDLLLQQLEQIPDDSPELRFGNSCFYVQFEEKRHKGLYGHSYRFFLQDAVEDVPEYIVVWENFVSLALEYRLKLVYKRTFHEILDEEQSSRDFGPLLGRMGVINDQGESAMDADQWEAANLYMGFAFEKI